MQEESKIIERVLAGKTDEFAYFLDAYAERLHLWVLRLVSCEQDAEEVVQDAFVKAYTHLSDFNRHSTFSTWLYRIAYNCAVQHLRRRQREPLLTIDNEQLSSVTDTMADESLAVDTEERIIALRKAIDLLTPDDRALITLFYYEGRSQADIAYVLSIAEGAVATRLSRVRKRLYLLLKSIDYES